MWKVTVCSGSYLSQGVGSVVGLQQGPSPSSGSSRVSDVTVLVDGLGQRHLDGRPVQHLQQDEKSPPVSNLPWATPPPPAGLTFPFSAFMALMASSL